jgi:hypothetical protein
MSMSVPRGSEKIRPAGTNNFWPPLASVARINTPHHTSSYLYQRDNES